jgi:hypothetical protein
VPRWWRWDRAGLFVLLAGIGALGRHTHTGQRAVRQLREAGFEMDSEAWLGARLWVAARQDWRLVFNSEVWESRPSLWKLDLAKAGALRNLDAIAPALRRVNPDRLDLSRCDALQNVDGLKGLSGLQTLYLVACPKISAPALRELRAALPKTDISVPDGSKLPPP